MTKSNYDITRDRMRGEFVKYDQEQMIKKFHLEHDEDYLYLDFVLHRYRIGRKDGVAEWSDDGFATCFEADFDESMTLYDILCCSKDDCCLSGSYCPVNSLKGVMHTSLSTDRFYQSVADEMSDRLEELEAACLRFGEKMSISGDLAVKLCPLSFMPVVLQFWTADDEFPAHLKFMFDENILQFMHYETVYYLTGHIVRRIQEMMGE